MTNFTVETCQEWVKWSGLMAKYVNSSDFWLNSADYFVFVCLSVLMATIASTIVVWSATRQSDKQQNSLFSSIYTRIRKMSNASLTFALPVAFHPQSSVSPASSEHLPSQSLLTQSFHRHQQCNEDTSVRVNQRVLPTDKSDHVSWNYYSAGSGIPELKSILSGFVIRGFLGIKTLIYKSIGLVCLLANDLTTRHLLFLLV